MVDGVGVCTVCAKVCHKDHDLSYAKCGSFFCDCGAKTDGSCQALVKRTASGSAAGGLDASSRDSTASPFSSEALLTSSLRKRQTPPVEKSTESRTKDVAVSKAREALLSQIEVKNER